MFQSEDYEDALIDESFSAIPDPSYESPGNDASLLNKKHLKLNNDNLRLNKDSLELNKENPQINNVTSLLKLPPRDLSSHDKINRIQNQNTSPDNNTPNKKRKRKFPGPAGLLPDDSNEKSHNSSVITPSQVCSSSQNQIPISVFEDGPWSTMLNDLKTYDCHSDTYTIAHINKLYMSHKFAGRRVPLLSGVIQNIDRTLQDPSITIRDQTGEIQGTLHHDAWEMYSCYLVPQYSVILLKNITLLTTGGISKKIYLNVTLNNIVAIYCDEDSAYAHKDKRQSIAPKENCNENYILDRVSWNSDEILVLRNASRSPETPRRDAASHNTSTRPSNLNQESLNESLTQELLDGVNIDAFLSDFD